MKRKENIRDPNRGVIVASWSCKLLILNIDFYSRYKMCYRIVALCITQFTRKYVTIILFTLTKNQGLRKKELLAIDKNTEAKMDMKTERERTSPRKEKKNRYKMEGM